MRSPSESTEGGRHREAKRRQKHIAMKRRRMNTTHWWKWISPQAKTCNDHAWFKMHVGDAHTFRNQVRQRTRAIRRTKRVENTSRASSADCILLTVAKVSYKFALQNLNALESVRAHQELSLRRNNAKQKQKKNNNKKKKCRRPLDR